MTLDDVITSSSSRPWFKLGDLLDSMLADAVAADANFQLTQAEAWGRFAKTVSELGTIPISEQLDFSAGFGRLENLGLSELSINVPLEVYKPSWMKRLWWGVLRIFGRKPTPQEERFRLARSGKKGVIALQIKAKRDEFGHWAVAKE